MIWQGFLGIDLEPLANLRINLHSAELHRRRGGRREKKNYLAGALRQAGEDGFLNNGFTFKQFRGRYVNN